MQSTNNLAVAARAKVVALTIYRLTAAFPPAERCGLSSQMRRAAVSIGSNIAEGCGRRGNRELLQCLDLAMGSASELLYQCELAADLGLGEPGPVAATISEVERVKAMLSRLITALRLTPDTTPAPAPATHA